MTSLPQLQVDMLLLWAPKPFPYNTSCEERGDPSLPFRQGLPGALRGREKSAP